MVSRRCRHIRRSSSSVTPSASNLDRNASPSTSLCMAVSIPTATLPRGRLNEVAEPRGGARMRSPTPRHRSARGFGSPRATWRAQRLTPRATPQPARRCGCRPRRADEPPSREAARPRGRRGRQAAGPPAGPPRPPAAGRRPRGRRGRHAEAAGLRRFPVAVRPKSMRDAERTERHGRPLRPPATDLPADSGRRARHGARNASPRAQRHKSRADVAARPRRLRRPGACRPHDHYYDSARRLRCSVTAPAVPSTSTSYVAGSSASASDSSGTTCSRTGNGAERAAVGVDGREAHGQHPPTRVVDRATSLPAQASGRGGEQLQRAAARAENGGDIGGRDREPADEQHAAPSSVSCT